MIAYTVNNEVIVVIVDGVSRVVPRGTAQASQLLAALKQTPIDERKVAMLADLKSALVAYAGGDCEILASGHVSWHGEALDPVLSEMVCENFKAGVPVDYLFKFFDRLDANPSAKVKGTLSAFLKHGGMPITKDGHFLAYKGVRANLYSIHAGDSSKLIEGAADEAGHICYAVGNVVRVKRNYVADDPDEGCSSGLHAGSERYAEAWARPHNGVVLLVDIDPADVVSVPKDSDCEKLRTCAYKIVARHLGRLGDAAVRDPSAPYATAYRGGDADDPLDEETETIPGNEEFDDREVELQRKPGRIVITIRK
jgi:hypothetical protein